MLRRLSLLTNGKQRAGLCAIRQAPSNGMKIQLKFVDSFGVYEDMVTSSCSHWVEIRYTGSVSATGPRSVLPNHSLICL